MYRGAHSACMEKKIGKRKELLLGNKRVEGYHYIIPITNMYLFSSQIHVYRDDCQNVNVLKTYRFLVNVTVSYAILS